MSKRITATHIAAIDPSTLETVTGGRFLFGGLQAGTAPAGLFPRFRQVAQGTFIASRQAAVGGGGGGGCANGQCGQG